MTETQSLYTWVYFRVNVKPGQCVSRDRWIKNSQKSERLPLFDRNNGICTTYDTDTSAKKMIKSSFLTCRAV